MACSFQVTLSLAPPASHEVGHLCVVLPTIHFILAWWIYKPRSFLQNLSHAHCLFIVIYLLPGSVAIVSLTGVLILPSPSWAPLGVSFHWIDHSFYGRHPTQIGLPARSAPVAVSEPSRSLQSSPHFLWLSSSLSWLSLMNLGC